MPPPPQQSLATRFLVGPALRCQPDGRLVSLVREGHETAFDEIVRRYGTGLQQYAAALVKRDRAEDVTQDAFSKAYVALRGSDKEIKLRPWLYRVVRNTALNDLRDQPPAGIELEDAHLAGEGPAETVERREQMRRLMEGLHELPESQRAAIVMRELEGLSHEQIAASLGLSGGAVRQSIYRARQTLRNGAGLLIPLPLIRMLLSHGPLADGASAATAGGGGIGAGMAAKAGIATLLAAGTVTTGAIVEQRGHDSNRAAAASGPTAGGESGGSGPDESGSGRGREGESGGGHEGGKGHGGHGGGDDSGTESHDSSGPGGTEPDEPETGDSSGPGRDGSGSGGPSPGDD